MPACSPPFRRTWYSRGPSPAPPKASKVPTDITEDTVREVALPLGYVDIKVAAFDEVWSALKLVIRKELR